MRNTLLPVLVMLCVAASAQESHFCYTTEMYLKTIHERPAVLRTQEALERFTEQFTNAQPNARTSGGVLVIPIVFHIIHNYGPENISDAQIYDQVRILNEDFRKQNPDTTIIVPDFKPIAADCEIEFRLATIDPNGNCTDGIDRIASTLTYDADDDSKLNPWPSNQYLNIWVVSDLGNSGAAAYAYYPGTAPAGKDGVISIHGYIGSIGTGSPGRSRVLTHEVGHCLNLAHVWGSTNSPGVACGNDGVSDTPVTEGWVSCNLNGSVCNPPLLENVQNYMEYSYCCNMFTEGQKTRMHAALNSSAGGRNNLWQLSNLIATGTDGSAAPLCAPISDFSVSHTFFCEGDTVVYHDLSWQGSPSAWNWSFPGGIPSSSTDSMPSVVYPVAGSYDVSLTVSNATGSDTKTRTTYVMVANGTPEPIPFVEGFENSFPGNNALIFNYDNGNTWQQVTGPAASGTHSMKMNNFTGNTTGEIDEYITPTYDFSNLEGTSMSFKLAYAQRTDTSRKDALKIYYSLNCGKTWILRYNKTGSGLATVAPKSTAFTPSSANDWRTEAVSAAIFAGKPSVKIKFQAISARGNNLYIDDINIFGSPVGIPTLASLNNSLELSPNPASGLLTIDFELDRKAQLSMDVFDLPGKKIKNVTDQVFDAGTHRIRFNSELPDGIYFLRINQDGNLTTRKFIIAN